LTQLPDSGGARVNEVPPQHLLAQLPFPSTRAPHGELAEYYRTYSATFRAAFPEFFVPEDSLWEAPLWAAHLAGMLESIGIEADLLDLSRTPATVEACVAAALDATRAGDLVYLSPLAQNFDLALGVSRALQDRSRRTVLGGNMATLAEAGDAALVFRGQLSPEQLEELLSRPAGSVTHSRLSRRGRIVWTPSYRVLEGFEGTVPLLRVNASHGCLFHCSFCGDAWSKQLHVVDRGALEREVADLEALFPQTRLVYVGDKSFGQSKEAVANLMHVFRERPRYRFIVQTHALLVNDALIEAMHELGVAVVELGLESGDPDLLRSANKATKGNDHYLEVIARLRAEGMRVVLNVLGGLPEETPKSHERTLAFIDAAGSDVWLFNLYNFVPYPLAPNFPSLRGRIFNWRFAEWREDAPPVFHPYEVTAAQSWDMFQEKIETAHGRLRAAARLAPVSAEPV
jgi:pyruvate-formate lyase-activating enzyme